MVHDPGLTMDGQYGMPTAPTTPTPSTSILPMTVTKNCPNCGAILLKITKWCNKCGYNFETGGITQPAQAPTVSGGAATATPTTPVATPTGGFGYSNPEWAALAAAWDPNNPVYAEGYDPSQGMGNVQQLTTPATVPCDAAGVPCSISGNPPVAPAGGDMSPYFEAGEMLTAPMSEYEQQALQMLSDLAGQLGGMVSPHETPMGQNVGTALTSLLSGEFPEEYFKTSIEAPAQKRHEEVTLPGVREAFVGPGTFWGGERATAEAKAGTDLDATLAAIRGDLGYRARQQALQALGPGMEYMGMPAEQLIQQMTGAGMYMGAGALPRLIEQHGLDIAYQEFIRTRPENQPYAQMLLSMLDIPMMASYAPETPESPLAPIANIFGTALPYLLSL